MAKLLICMADGLEEVEALTTVDLVRRADIEMDMVAIKEKKNIMGAHGIEIVTDKCFSEINLSEYDGIVLPGGMPGTNYLRESENVIAAVKEFFKAKKLVAAICAAPTVLGYAGVLEGKNATCYPGMEEGLSGACAKEEEVVCDGNVITSRGVGTAIPFALSIVSYFTDAKKAESLGKSIVYKAN
ncbi:MAG: DJ-1/PfpI family protein [Lachnospiraceae bacterium]|nr:DJ-1/PfpI family protein [Lachnospiraceae bacterium]